MASSPCCSRRFRRAWCATTAAASGRHRLRREIVATVAANELVNRGGIAFVNEQMAESGRDAGDVARAFAIARGAFDLDATWDGVRALDNKIDAATQTDMLHDWRRLAAGFDRLAVAATRRSSTSPPTSRAIGRAWQRSRHSLARSSRRTPSPRSEKRAMRCAPRACRSRWPRAWRGSTCSIQRSPSSSLAPIRSRPATDSSPSAPRCGLDRMVAKLRALVGSGLWQQRAAESLIEELYRGPGCHHPARRRRPRRAVREAPRRRRPFLGHRRGDRNRPGRRPA